MHEKVEPSKGIFTQTYNLLQEKIDLRNSRHLLRTLSPTFTPRSSKVSANECFTHTGRSSNNSQTIICHFHRSEFLGMDFSQFTFLGICKNVKPKQKKKLQNQTVLQPFHFNFDERNEIYMFISHVNKTKHLMKHIK